MELDYQEIGRRIAKRRRELGYKQAQVEELAGIGYKYLSSIERGISIPSTEVIMRLAIALDTTPDEFLVGTARHEDAAWRSGSSTGWPSRSSERFFGFFPDILAETGVSAGIFSPFGASFQNPAGAGWWFCRKEGAGRGRFSPKFPAFPLAFFIVIAYNGFH